MTLPATPSSESPWATEDEIQGALKALFDQFPTADGDAGGKYLGYILALEGEPIWAIRHAVRKYLRGEVDGHDGRFLPTSAELARTVRAESAFSRRMAERDAQAQRQIAARDNPALLTSKPRASVEKPPLRIAGVNVALRRMDDA